MVMEKWHFYMCSPCELIVTIPVVVSAAGVQLRYRTHRHHCYCLSPHHISVFIINNLLRDEYT